MPKPGRADISPRLHVKLLEHAGAFLALDEPQTAMSWLQRAVEISRSLGPEGKEILVQKRKPWEDSSLDTLLPGWSEGPDQAAISAAFEAGKALNAEQALALALDDPSTYSPRTPFTSE